MSTTCTWRRTGIAIVTLLVVGSVTASALSANGPLATADSGADNEPPLADAGLDQEVTKGATVLLDATGSRDPDGHIRRYQWSIRTPSNATTTPDCRDCNRTSFEPSEVGEYRVTLTVTDDDGAARSDTLYVEVSPGREPAVSLSGPERPTVGATATYTAALDAGTAALDYAVWTVDGAEIANQSLSADQRSTETSKQFPTPDARSMTVTVYDVDGQSASDSLSVSVRGEPGDSPSGDETPRRESTIADRNDPTVSGDAVVTGTKPLRGEYELQFDARSETVASVEWRNVAGRVATGSSMARTWTPGEHELYAVVTYVDGSENVATFADGTTTVVADPKPNVSVESLDRWGSISGVVSGSDDYENLVALHVEVEGETVATSSSIRRNPGGTDQQQTLRFSHHQFTPGERTSVTVVATDARGQTTTVTREVVPVEEPEIVRSEFTNSPVDSYHERIDPSRYTARHILEVDLNGVDPDNVSLQIEADAEGTVPRYDGSPYEDRSAENSILIESFWSGSTPGRYAVRYGYEMKVEDVEWAEEGRSKFNVTPSKPELRLNVLNDGTKDYITREHGILVDASGSFDPDKTELKYIWKHGAEPAKPDNTTAKFSAYEHAESVVEDGYKLRVKENFNFLSYYMPGIESVTPITDQPYLPNETARFRVTSKAFHFSKPTYYDDFSLAIDTGVSEANVLSWRQVPATNTSHSEATEDPYRYAGIVEIPVSELSASSQMPTITVYNEENERKSERVGFPETNVLLLDDAYLENGSVRDLEYTVEKPVIDEVSVESKEKRDEYLDDGYSVASTDHRIEHVLEERVKVADAKYEAERKQFESERLRNSFLGTQSDWQRAGTTTEKITRTRTNIDWYSADNVESRSKWHDGNLWNGEYTGQSRDVVVDPAQYQTQKQYEYNYEVERTGTRTVTRTRTVQVRRTGTRTVMECPRPFRCYPTTETYTYHTTETRTYTTTETYTYTVTKTETYWAASERATRHDPTGKTRQVKIDDAEYETQHQIKQKEQYTDSATRYVVARDKLVQPAQYEWKASHSTTDYQQAQRTASNDGWRLGESGPSTEWTLRKQVGTKRFVTSQYYNSSHVVETSATVVADRVRRYYNPETGEKVTVPLGQVTEQETFHGMKSRQAVLSEVTEPDGGNEECKLKKICV